MVKEYVLVAAHFLCLKDPNFSLESALEIVEKEFSQHGVFIHEGVCIGDKPIKPETCQGCGEIKLCYGGNVLRFCAKCLLPNSYEKYLKNPPTKTFKTRNSEFINKLEQQIKFLTKK